MGQRSRRTKKNFIVSYKNARVVLGEKNARKMNEGKICGKLLIFVSLKPIVAPIKCAVLPLTGADELVPMIDRVCT